MILTETLSGLFGPYLATVIGFALALALFTHVLRRQQRQSASIAWLLAFVLAPVVFVPAYVLFAGRKIASKARRKQPLHSHLQHESVALAGTSADIESIMRGFDLPAASGGNRIALITSGEQAYRELCSLIDAAQHSIHIATFVLARDEVGRAIVARLARKASEGVKVRLMVDALGSLGARFTILRSVQKAGVSVGVFMPMLMLRRRWKADLRNHRKLAVFDGRVALTGGMNIGSDYMGPTQTPSRWIDSMVRIEGPAVGDLEGVFEDDWEFATDERLSPALAGGDPAAGSQVAQVVPSGPDVVHDALYDGVVVSVYKARHRVWLVTPYFVPDTGLMRALLLQARLGCDVRVIVPKRSDHWIADMARARMVRELQAAGGRILLHPDRMVHAKQLIVDDALSVHGSANLDMRSLYLNYELTVFCYDRDTIEASARWFESLVDDCVEHSSSEPGFVRRAVEDLCWLTGPLL